MLVYTPIPPTHAIALQLMPMDMVGKTQGRVKLQIDWLLDMHKYNKSLMVHLIVFQVSLIENDLDFDVQGHFILYSSAIF